MWQPTKTLTWSTAQKYPSSIPSKNAQMRSSELTCSTLWTERYLAKRKQIINRFFRFEYVLNLYLQKIPYFPIFFSSWVAQRPRNLWLQGGNWRKTSSCRSSQKTLKFSRRTSKINLNKKMQEDLVERVWSWILWKGTSTSCLAWLRSRRKKKPNK